MKIFEILDFLWQHFPEKLAATYDNVGLLVGDRLAEVNGIVVALDCTDETIKFANQNNCNLILTHHPIIFEPIKTVLCDSPVFSLIQNGISLISMHTNLDAASGGVNDTLCETLELLNVHGFSPIEDYGYEARFGTLSSPVTADGFAEFIKEKLGGTVKYIDGGQKIKTVCVCSGSGGSLLREAVATGAEAFVTGDVKHSVFLEAQRNKISLFDAGHWNTENIIIDKLSQLLRENFSQVNVLPFCHKSIKFC